MVEILSPCCLAPLGMTPKGASCPRCSRTFPLRRGVFDLRLGGSWRALDTVNALPLVAWAYPFWRSRSTHLLTGGTLDHEEELAHLEAAFSGLSGPFLDVGAGAGAYLRPLLRMGPTFGVDASLAFLEVARRRFPDAVLFLAKAEALPFPTGAFQGVAFGPTLNELQNPHRGLLEAYRVLHPGGRLFFALALGRGRKFGLWLPTEEEAALALMGAGFRILWKLSQGRFLLGSAQKP